MYYAPDGSARFVGLARIAGSVGDRNGTVVVQSTGVFDGKEVRATGWSWVRPAIWKGSAAPACSRHHSARVAHTRSTTTSDGRRPRRLRSRRQLAGVLGLASTDRISESVSSATRLPESRRGRTVRTALLAGAAVDRHGASCARHHVVGSGSPRRPSRYGRIRDAWPATMRARRSRPHGRRPPHRRRSRARAEPLVQALSACRLGTRTRSFETLMGKAAVGMIREPGAVRWTCRLCDTKVCGRYAVGCPVGNAAADRTRSVTASPSGPVRRTAKRLAVAISNVKVSRSNAMWCCGTTKRGG